MKEGVSAYWFSAQAVNTKKVRVERSNTLRTKLTSSLQRVADLQVSTDGGSTWQSGLSRQDYNFFQESSGFGTTSVAVKVVSIDGDEVVVDDVNVTGGTLVTATANF